jgi:hypothetical protein
MGTQKRTTIVYEVRRIDGLWEVFDRDGRRHAVEPLRTKGDAVVHAKELARRGGAQILVYGDEGKLESEFFYGPEERAALQHDDEVPSLAASQPVTFEKR